MAFVASKVRDRVKKVTKRFEDGQSLTVEYRPHVYTLEEQGAFEDRINDPSLSTVDKMELMADYLAQTVVDSDWVEEEGGPKVPFTKERLLKEDADVVLFIFTMIAEDKAAGKPKR